MLIGQMKHRITLLEEATTVSPNGFEEKSLNEVKSLWASIQNNRKIPKKENDSESVEESFVFVIRYQEISENYLISYQDKKYEIVSIEDRTFEKKFLSVSVKGVK